MRYCIMSDNICGISHFAVKHIFTDDLTANSIGSQKPYTLSLMGRTAVFTPANESKIRGYNMCCDAEVY